MMKKIIIYGIGKEFDYYYDLYKKLNASFKIVGCYDKNIEQLNKKAKENKLDILTYEEMLECKDCDGIYVATLQYYQEIKMELIKKGENKRIALFSELLFETIMKNCTDVKDAIDIGGPSGVFLPLYNLIKKIDIANYSDNNLWAKTDFEKIYGPYVEIKKYFNNDATNLKDISDASYDLVCSSNTLEHIANPLKALLEWKRVLKSGGILLIFVPNKNFTYDRNRDYTAFDHLLADYNNDIGESDLYHLKEVVEKTDIEDFNFFSVKKVKNREEHKNMLEENEKIRMMHHHVFNFEPLILTAKWLNMSVLSAELDNYCHNLCFVLKK